MLIARILIACFIWFIIFSGGVFYTFNQTRIYQASGSLQLLDRQPIKRLTLDDLLEPLPTATDNPSTATDSVQQPASTRSAEDLQTEIIRLQSGTIVQNVERRLQGNERERLMAPYVAAIEYSGPLSPMEVLQQNRSIHQQGQSRVVTVNFRHPDPVVAAKVANLFMNEYINYNLTEEIDTYMKMVEDLRIRIELTDQRITELSANYERLKIKVENTAGVHTANNHYNAELETAKQALNADIGFRTKLYGAMREAQTRLNIANPHAVILDQAFPPLHQDSPNISRALTIAVGFASLLSIGFFALSGLIRTNKAK